MVAPDHPGFGRSDDFAEVEAIDDLVNHYLDVMDQLGLDRPHVVGASFGGWVAAELAVAAPHRIGSLVLLAPAGLRLPEHPVADLFIMSPDQLVTTLFHDPGAAGMLPAEPDLDFELAQYRDMTALARFDWTPFLSNPKLERRLHRITPPTLVAARPTTGSSPSRTAGDRPSSSGARFADRGPLPARPAERLPRLSPVPGYVAARGRREPGGIGRFRRARHHGRQLGESEALALERLHAAQQDAQFGVDDHLDAVVEVVAQAGPGPDVVAPRRGLTATRRGRRRSPALARPGKTR